MTKTATKTATRATTAHKIDVAAGAWTAAKEAFDAAEAALKAARANLEALVPPGTEFPAHLAAAGLRWQAAERMVVVDQDAFLAGPTVCQKVVLDTPKARAWSQVTGQAVPGTATRTDWSLRW